MQHDRYADLTTLSVDELHALVEQLRIEEAEARAVLQACLDEVRRHPGSDAQRRLAQMEARHHIAQLRRSTALHMLQARRLGVSFKRDGD